MGNTRVSQCEGCRHMREVRTARSRFLLCELSTTNAAFAKYPPQPVARCAGYEAIKPEAESSTAAAPHPRSPTDRKGTDA
jgi:hypothetical protein